MAAIHRACAVVLLALGLAACGGHESTTPARPMQASATATSTVGDATLQTSTMAVADLNDSVAQRYAIDRSQQGLLLLVTVRDADGNGIAPGDLRLDATAATLTDAATPVAMHPITTGGMTDYIGVFAVQPPATVKFRISAVRDGARAGISTNAELYPR